MARKPNYDFERRERDRLKAAKTAAKAAAKQAQRQRQRDGEAGGGPGAEAPPAEKD